MASRGTAQFHFEPPTSLNYGYIHCCGVQAKQVQQYCRIEVRSRFPERRNTVLHAPDGDHDRLFIPARRLRFMAGAAHVAGHDVELLFQAAFSRSFPTLRAGGHPSEPSNRSFGWRGGFAGLCFVVETSALTLLLSACEPALLKRAISVSLAIHLPLKLEA
ncbi:hypothetical protein EXIGLDRAFT_768798 [Exidia glandulosa HHB12029]|uniref:Uncharacterized protein n=1 Tax=Exidia glandulosa HHB12029 TaxID=1314781 RepID=A0A165HZQ5_EXIGL|nr:hypothetical protein EXIGLDRAFT_768798 [Exidia glandulosa HHB12029]